MRRIMNTLWLAALCCAAANAMGATVRFQGRPTTTDNGTTLGIQGALQGLGAHDFTVRVRATGSASVQCVNPSGNEPAGQSRQVAVTVAGEQLIRASDVTGGNALFSVVTAEPEVSNACPNDKWTAQVQDVTFRTVTLRVFQDGRVVLRRTWSM